MGRLYLISHVRHFLSARKAFPTLFIDIGCDDPRWVAFDIAREID